MFFVSYYCSCHHMRFSLDIPPWLTLPFLHFSLNVLFFFLYTTALFVTASVVCSTANPDFITGFSLLSLFYFQVPMNRFFSTFSCSSSVSQLCILALQPFSSCTLCPPLKSHVDSTTVFYGISSPKVFPMKSYQKIHFSITIQRHCTSSPRQHLYC